MFLLSAVESRYLMGLDNINKYRTLLSVYRNYLFDYNSYTDIFTIYMYRGNQCTAPVKCPLEQFKDRMLSLLRNDAEKKEFNVFIIILKQVLICLAAWFIFHLVRTMMNYISLRLMATVFCQ